jgi:hypothetical protein
MATDLLFVAPVHEARPREDQNPLLPLPGDLPHPENGTLFPNLGALKERLHTRYLSSNSTAPRKFRWRL